MDSGLMILAATFAIGGVVGYALRAYKSHRRRRRARVERFARQEN